MVEPEPMKAGRCKQRGLNGRGSASAIQSSPLVQSDTFEYSVPAHAAPGDGHWDPDKDELSLPNRVVRRVAVRLRVHQLLAYAGE